MLYMYEGEVMHYREGDLAKFERAKKLVGRLGLGLPRSTAVESVRGEMGWSSFRERVVKGKLGMLKKIGLEDGRWVKQVLRETSNTSSWKKKLTNGKGRKP